MSSSQVQQALKKLASEEKSQILTRFFKTAKGEYGEGDVFIGVVVPEQRKIAKEFRDLPLNEVAKLLKSKIHEDRLTALLILTYKYPKLEQQEKKKIIDFYLKHTAYINNWDLVDLSAYKLLGEYLIDKDRTLLYELAKSKNLWERRIAMISTFTFIRNKDFADTLKIAGILLQDKHDLMHKAVGWMLREIGKRDIKTEEEFLRKYYKKMPRTMLRYAIEKFDENKRKFYLGK
ncbi:MAG: DNA alkylation repair protein [Candidatus Gracilibacteria bacterium]|nr:DNA alkylation repair protein [Candidatus Gracilibacteria bacterium]